ncbi:hypothetical protein, partial [Pseudomonas aeruginosa]|uniref:hypothetical protein n=1 Tax=Pseudomonas aeruginosa TaxID=287 RepID=UPI00376F3EBD
WKKFLMLQTSNSSVSFIAIFVYFEYKGCVGATPQSCVPFETEHFFGESHDHRRPQSHNSP